MPLLVLALLLLGPGPATAQGGPAAPRPHPAERAWLEACVLTAQAHPPRAAFGRCGWRIAAACRGEAGEGLLVARLPPLPGRPASGPACAQVETALWREQADRWLRALMLLVPTAQQAPLRRVQAAFVAYREAACALEGALAPPAEAEANRLACRLEHTALRALDLKRLRDERWLAIAAASAEGP